MTGEKFYEKILSLTKHNLELRALPSKKQIFTRDTKDIEKFIQTNINENLYHGVFTREGGGSKDHVREVVCFFADLDFKNYLGGEVEAWDRLKKFQYNPTFIINSGNGFHVYWFLTEAVEPSEKIEPILRGIAQTLKSDPSVCELARIMRVPGTFNYKHGDKKECRIIEHNPDAVYNLSDLFKYAKTGQQAADSKTPLKELYQGVSEGSRNDSLTRLIGSWVNDGLSFDECLEMAHTWNSRNAPPLPEKEVQATVRSILAKHQRELSGFSNIGGGQSDTSGIEPFYVLKKGSDLRTLDCTIEWLIDNLLPKQSITLLHGRGGIGKTWLSLIIADCISKGLQFMALNAQTMPVVFIDFENSLPVLVDRVRKIGIEDVLFWHNANEELRPPKLDKPEWQLYKKLPSGSLLIFDTLRAAQGQDENDSKNMAFIMSRLKELRDMGFTILLLHHTPKSNDRTYKGSTAILDLADHVLSLHKVRKTNPEGSEVDEDEDDHNCYYRLGTKDKTRYEPFHIFMMFDRERGFIKALDPDEETLQAIYELIEEKGTLNQKKLFDVIKEELDIRGKGKAVSLLRKGDGKYWTSNRVKNTVYYEAIGSVQVSDPIYQTDGHFSEESLITVQTIPLSDTAQTLDNSQVSKCPATPQTVRTDEIIEVLGVSE